MLDWDRLNVELPVLVSFRVDVPAGSSSDAASALRLRELEEVAPVLVLAWSDSMVVGTELVIPVLVLAWFD